MLVKESNMTKDEYLKQQAKWIKYRLEMLDEIEAKLVAMKKLAEYARDNDLDDKEKEEINQKLQNLQKEVDELDEKSKRFWVEWQ